MAKPDRVKIPRAVHDEVMKEFNYHCAVCGADHPQLHHLDENPSNNEAENLLPLCPNCHLTDQHSPWRAHDPRKLRLFRTFKDRAILSPQFEALFRRLLFLDVVDGAMPYDVLLNNIGDLTSFVRGLEMGGYYTTKISDLLGAPHCTLSPITVLTGDDVEFNRGQSLRHAELSQWHEEHREKVRMNRMHVLEASVELLRFQTWALPDGRKST